MKKYLLFILTIIAVISVASGCSSDYETITIAWYPNESGVELKDARDEFGKIIEDATGKKVKHQTTTDYNIVIEAVANGNAHVAWMGAEGYTKTHKQNPDCLPLVVPSGKSGTLDDALYYSWLNVKYGNEDQWKDGNKFSIENLPGKRFSFVSNSSTSGFKVPSTGILNYFTKKDEYKDLEREDLLEGGEGKFFSEVLFGGSHQGSCVNLLTDKADIAAFCDSCVANYVELDSGEVNTPGAIYKIKEGAAEPFENLVGEKFVVISVTPVLNAPFVYNSKALSKEDYEKIVEALTSEETAKNEKIFVPEGSDFAGILKKEGEERLIKIEDSWFDEFRKFNP